MLLQVNQQNVVINDGDKFTIESNGLNSYLNYRIFNNTLDLYCAFVPEVSWGNGHACSLILFALQYAVLNGLRVKPNCAAAKAYVKINPEWRYILTA